jgi:hypothetical protein
VVFVSLLSCWPVDYNYYNEPSADNFKSSVPRSFIYLFQSWSPRCFDFSLVKDNRFSLLVNLGAKVCSDSLSIFYCKLYFFASIFFFHSVFLSCTPSSFTVAVLTSFSNDPLIFNRILLVNAQGYVIFCSGILMPTNPSCLRKDTSPSLPKSCLVVISGYIEDSPTNVLVWVLLPFDFTILGLWIL